MRSAGRRQTAALAIVLILVAVGFAGWTRLGAGGPPQGVSPGADERPSSGAPSAPQDLPRDLTSSASATASGFADSTTEGGVLVSFLASNVLDGNPNTAWRTYGPGDGETLTLEFPRAFTVTQVGLALGEPGVVNGDPAETRRGRSVERVTWTAGGLSVEQVLDPERLDVQSRLWPSPVATRVLTLRLDRTTPGPVGSDDFSAVTQVMLFGTG